MSNNAPDYENDLVFPPERGLALKLAHSEKMRDYTAEYVAKLEEKLRIAENYFQRILDVNTKRAIDSYQKCQILAESALLKIKE